MKMLNFNLAIVLYVILMAIFSKNFTSNYSSCFIMERRNDEERDRLWQLMQWQLRGLRVENLLLVIRFISIRSPFSIFASHLSHVIDARTLRRVWSILFNSLYPDGTVFSPYFWFCFNSDLCLVWKPNGRKRKIQRYEFLIQFKNVRLWIELNELMQNRKPNGVACHRKRWRCPMCNWSMSKKKWLCCVCVRHKQL